MSGEVKKGVSQLLCPLLRRVSSPEQQLHAEVLLDERLERPVLTGHALEPVHLGGSSGLGLGLGLGLGVGLGLGLGLGSGLGLGG